MKLILSLLLLIIPVRAATGQVVNHYKIDIEILPEEEMLRADAMISVTVPQEGLRNIRFLLNRGLEIKRLSCTSRKHFRLPNGSNSMLQSYSVPIRWRSNDILVQRFHRIVAGRMHFSAANMKVNTMSIWSHPKS